RPARPAPSASRAPTRRSRPGSPPSTTCSAAPARWRPCSRCGSSSTAARAGTPRPPTGPRPPP
ncbi:MAG: hypothetical protein AVDCRST_MAG66-803, partial [uncultured Pseudonocardia sp.]